MISTDRNKFNLCRISPFYLGFTLIDMVVFVAIFGILVTISIQKLPSLFNMNGANQTEKVNKVAELLSSKVLSARVSWASNGFTVAANDLQGFSDGSWDTSPAGWPTDAGLHSDSNDTNMSVKSCTHLLNALAQERDASSLDIDSDFQVKIKNDSRGTKNKDCLFMVEGERNAVTYDADTGSVYVFLI